MQVLTLGLPYASNVCHYMTNRNSATFSRSSWRLGVRRR